MHSVRVLCDTGVFLNGGRITYMGIITGAIDRYSSSFGNSIDVQVDPDHRPGSGEFRFTDVRSAKQAFTCAEDKLINWTLKRRRPVTTGPIFVSARVINDAGNIISQCDSRMLDFWVEPRDTQSGCLRIRALWLRPGEYRISLFICSSGIIDAFDDSCRLNVMPVLPYSAAGGSEATREGVVFADFSYESALSGFETLE